MTPTDTPGPHFTCDVYPAGHLVVSVGVNLGDGLDSGEALCAGDVYQLVRDASARRVRIEPGEGRTMRLADTGATLRLRARLMMMGAGGTALRLLLLERGPDSAGPDEGPDEMLVLPLTPLEPRLDYTLVRIEEDPDDVRLSDVLCASFLAGTLIALADGRQVRIETLKSGDRLLTRDHGAQPLRWIGKATLRATGSFAPVVIASGTLGNEGDLIVSQHHRLFLYQRHDPAALPGPELLVQAGALVDGCAIRLRPGGFVDYYSLAFDRHEIVYAHGVPVESLLVTDATIGRLPEALAEDLRSRFPALAHSQHFGTEVTGRLIEQVRAAALQSRERSGGAAATGAPALPLAANEGGPDSKAPPRGGGRD